MLDAAGLEWQICLQKVAVGDIGAVTHSARVILILNPKPFHQRCMCVFDAFHGIQGLIQQRRCFFAPSVLVKIAVAALLISRPSSVEHRLGTSNIRRVHL